MQQCRGGHIIKAKALAKESRILIMAEPTAPLSMVEVESLGLLGLVGAGRTEFAKV